MSKEKEGKAKSNKRLPAKTLKEKRAAKKSKRNKTPVTGLTAFGHGK